MFRGAHGILLEKVPEIAVMQYLEWKKRKTKTWRRRKKRETKIWRRRRRKTYQQNLQKKRRRRNLTD
jgi:hypothetical protein